MKRFRRETSSPKPTKTSGRLSSWDEIALYLGRGRRTVQRWHSTLELPVHKVNATARSKVFAYKAEIDRWLEMRAERDRVEIPAPGGERIQNTRLFRVRSAAKRMMLMTSTQYDQVASIRDRVRRMVERQKQRQRAGGVSPPGAGKTS